VYHIPAHVHCAEHVQYNILQIQTYINVHVP
jgi:hypothetical protein